MIFPCKRNHTGPYGQPWESLARFHRYRTGKVCSMQHTKKKCLWYLRKQTWIWLKCLIVFHAYRLQYPHSPATEASCKPVFGEVKPRNTIPSPSLSVPSAPAKPALLVPSFVCVSKRAKCFSFLRLLLSNLRDPKCCKRSQSLSKLWVLQSQLVRLQRYCADIGALAVFLRESLLTVPSVASYNLRGGSTGSSVWTENGFQMSENIMCIWTGSD